jgi:peptidyl-tRNA hydrolase
MAVSRKDLTPGQQAVQSGHAALDYTFQHPELAKHWHKSSNYLIYLSANTEEELSRLSEKLQCLGVEVTEFREPDLDNQLTAIAFLSEEKTRRVTSGLPLAFKTPKMAATL